MANIPNILDTVREFLRYTDRDTITKDFDKYFGQIPILMNNGVQFYMKIKLLPVPNSDTEFNLTLFFNSSNASSLQLSTVYTSSIGVEGTLDSDNTSFDTFSWGNVVSVLNDIGWIVLRSEMESVSSSIFNDATIRNLFEKILKE